jgi:hypothetical protein
MIKNKLFVSNYDDHNVRTRQCENLHYPSTVNWRSFMALIFNLFLMYLYQLNLHLSVCI